MRQSAHPVEGGDANWGNGSFEPTGEHDLGMPAADRLISLPNGIRSGGAGGGQTDIGALSASAQGHLS